jgi:cobalt-zinc-cadmium efflux system outer membrane protein
MSKRKPLRIGLNLLLLIPTGCAQVNPGTDYRRAAIEVIAATGQTAVYDPNDDAKAGQKVCELLGNGISAEDAVRIALLNNPTLQAAFFRIGMARADLVQSGLFSNPSLAFSLQFPEGGGRSNLQASLAQNIVDLWRIPVRRRVAESTLTETVLTIAREGTQLAADAKSAYFAAVAADRNLSIVKENLDVAQGLLKATLARQKAGAVGELDVNLARSPALNAELHVRTARLDVGTARRRLAILLGLTLKAEDLNLTDPLPQPPEARLSPDRVVEVALSARLDLKAARQATSAAEERVREECLQVFPNIEVGPFLERAESRALPGRNILADTARASVAAGALTAPDIQSRGQRNQERRQEIDSILGPALTMTLPIFDQNQAQIAKAEYAYQQALRQLDAIERTVVQDTRQAVDRAMTAWEVARFYETQIVPQAQKSLDLSDTTYQAGKTSIITVLEAQRTLLATRRIAIDALRTAAETIADLERITGRPATVLLSQPTTETDTKPMQDRIPAQSSTEVQP